MAVRLNKAIRELNIGLQTAVEFLEKKKELGEVKPELAFKLSDAQYEALVEAFKQDKEVRTQADKLFQKKPKEKKPAEQPKATRAEGLLESSNQQQFKPLGKIDLGTVGKKPSEAKASEKKAAEEKPAAKASVKAPEETKKESTEKTVEAAAVSPESK